MSGVEGLPTGREIVARQKPVPPELRARMVERLGETVTTRVLADMHAVADGCYEAIGDRHVPDAAAVLIAEASALIASVNEPAVLDDACAEQRRSMLG
jgi:hypothetical protein